MNRRPYLHEIRLSRQKISSFETYPFNIPVIRALKKIKFHRSVTFLVGENGSGKSTLIEAIALWLGFSLQGGTKNIQTFSNDGSSLYQFIEGVKDCLRPTDYYFLRAETFHNIASRLEDLYENETSLFLKQYGVESLHACSHGESFLAILSKKLSGNGLYIFDEPESALSPMKQLSALKLINDLVMQNSQFIIATHSPILLSYPNACIFSLDNNGIKKIKYEETEHFMVSKYFLNNYREMNDIILKSTAG